MQLNIGFFAHLSTSPLSVVRPSVRARERPLTFALNNFSETAGQILN